MKIRNGFVSNSSSSSFLIIGSTLKESTKELCEKYILNDVKFAKYVAHWTKKICCGKDVKTSFCPDCGKKSEEISGEILYDKLFKELKNDISFGKGLSIIDEDYEFNDLIIGSHLGETTSYENVAKIADILKSLGYTDIKLYSGENSY